MHSKQADLSIAPVDPLFTELVVLHPDRTNLMKSILMLLFVFTTVAVSSAQGSHDTSFCGAAALHDSRWG